MTPLETPAPARRRTRWPVLVVAAILLVAGAATATWLLTRPKAAAGPAAASVPVIQNIPRPNAACTPAADRKLGSGDDLSSIDFFGYIDGKQQEMLVGNAMMQVLAGHKVEYVWYCPLRSQWH